MQMYTYSSRHLHFDKLLQKHMYFSHYDGMREASSSDCDTTVPYQVSWTLPYSGGDCRCCMSYHNQGRMRLAERKYSHFFYDHQMNFPSVFLFNMYIWVHVFGNTKP